MNQPRRVSATQVIQVTPVWTRLPPFGRVPLPPRSHACHDVHRRARTPRPVRRGVKAAPQILVLMVQVRSLAAELLAPAGSESGSTKVVRPDVDGERDDHRDGTDRPALDDRSDAWLVGRARELLAITQMGDRGD